MPVTVREEPISDEQRRRAQVSSADHRSRRHPRLVVHGLRGLAVLLVLTPLVLHSTASVWVAMLGLLVGIVGEWCGRLTSLRTPDDRFKQSAVEWLKGGVSRLFEVEVRRVFQAEDAQAFLLDCGGDALICADWWFWSLRDFSSQFMEDHGRETPEEFAPARFTVEFAPHPVPHGFLPDAMIIELERQRLPACPDRDLQHEINEQGVLHLPFNRLPPSWRSLLDAPQP